MGLSVGESLLQEVCRAELFIQECALGVKSPTQHFGFLQTKILNKIHGFYG